MDETKVNGSKEAVRHYNVRRLKEVEQIIIADDNRTKVSIALLAYSGERIGFLGNVDGTEGLRHGDFLQARLHPEHKFTTIIPRVNNIQTLSKAIQEYFCLLPELTTLFIKQYIKKRKIGQEGLTEKSPLVKAKEACKIPDEMKFFALVIL